MPFVCDPCKPAYNLVARKKRAGEPTNLKFTPCDGCRALGRAYPRKSRARGATEPDEMMVERLLYAPDSWATKVERRAATVILLKRGHDTYPEIAARVGITSRTVQRIAAELGIGKPRPRHEVELGACETRAEVWQLMWRGHSARGAGRSLGVAASTVDRHVEKLREIGVL